MSDTTSFHPSTPSSRATAAISGVVAKPHQLDELIAQLRPFQGSNTLATCLEVGRLVLARFYGGSLESFRALGTKHVSFRKLSEVPELPFSGLFLYRAVCIYDVYYRHSAWRFSHNGMSHFRAVLSLPDEVQRDLLDSSEEQGWTVNRLQHEASLRRASAPEIGGRPPRPAFLKSLRSLRKHPKPGYHGYADIERASELEPCERQELRRLADELSAHFESISARLQNG